MRAIDGDKLKRKVQKVATEAWKMKLTARVETVLNQCIDYIDNTPTIEPEQQWIPVTERLPEKECFALVTVNDGAIYTDLSLFRKDGRFIEHTGDVIAWMPLPEPYREGKE